MIACAGPSSCADATADGTWCIVAFGDSTTVGYSVGESYPQTLAHQLFKQGATATVINSGVNGDATSGARERFERDVLAHSPDVVVIQFGLNDQTVRLYQRPEEVKSYLTEVQFRANLQYFVAELRQRGTEVVLMTPNPMCWTPTLERHYPDGPFLDGPRGGNSLLRRYVAAVRQLAKAEDVPLVDVFEAYEAYEKAGEQKLQELFLEDGVHPNEIGYDLNVKLLWQALHPLITTQEIASTPRNVTSFTVVRNGTPMSAYIAGWGCRRREGHFELARIEHDRNPKDYLSAPVPLGDADWRVELDITALEDSEWAIELGDSGRLAFSARTGKVDLDGPLFKSPSKELFAQKYPIESGDVKFVLRSIGERLHLLIGGTEIDAIDVGRASIGPARITTVSGTIHIRNFRVL